MKKIILLTAVSFLLLRTAFAFTIQLDAKSSACGNNNGSIRATLFGATLPITYQWSDGQTTEIATNLAPGVYTVVVTDANTTDSASVTMIDEPYLSGGDLSYIVPGGFGGATHPCQSQCNGIAYLDSWLFEGLNGTGPYSLYTSMGHTIGFYAPANCLTVEGICCTDNYTAVVTDVYGCSGSVYVNPPYNPASFAFNAVIAPACDGVPNGSVSLDFYESWGFGYSITWTGPSPGSTFGNINLFANSLLPGNYVFVVSQDVSNGCDSTFNIVIPSLGIDCGVISGVTYLDSISNCIADGSEPLIPSRMIRFTPGPYYATSDSTGNYTAIMPYGTYTGETVTNFNYTSVCAVNGLNLSAANDTITGVDLGDSAAFDLDLEVTMCASTARPGFNYTIYITVHNHGYNSVTSPEIILDYQPFLNFINASVPSTVTGVSQVTLQLPLIGPFDYQQYTILFSVPANPNLIGVNLTNTATVNAGQPEINLSNNIFTLNQTVSGSFDPNSKTVGPDTDSSYTFLLDVEDYFFYSIRFQNSGTDTAFTVVLVDTLNQYLDPATVIMTGSSHPCNWEITGANILKVHYNNILLPDSNVNEPASHGQFGFRITKDPSMFTLSLPYTLTNSAGIYFDFNPAVITNTAYAEIAYSVGLSEASANEMQVFPVPADDILYLKLKDQRTADVVRILDIQSRTVFYKENINVIDVSNLTPGMYFLKAVVGGDERVFKVLIN